MLALRAHVLCMNQFAQEPCIMISACPYNNYYDHAVVSQTNHAGIYSFHLASCQKYDHTHQLAIVPVHEYECVYHQQKGGGVPD